MAGSYNHVVNEENGQLYVYGDMMKMIPSPGDAYETIEEMYGMIWFLATSIDADEAHDIVERARKRYKLGLGMSPGTKAFLPGERS